MYTVLIVDDETPARNMVKLVLDWGACGFEIIGEALNGADALKQCLTLKPDLVITDIQMPIMDGIEFIKQAKAAGSAAHFIILSCYESFSYAQQSIKLGVCDYLIKDLITKEQLQDTLNQIIPKFNTSHLPLPAKTSATVMSKEFSADFDKLKAIYPSSSANIEWKLDRLFSYLLTRNIAAAQTNIRSLYSQNFPGLVQYSYLNYINSLIFYWLFDMCMKHDIPYNKLFHNNKIPNDILLTTDSPTVACEAFCEWIQTLDALLDEPPRYSHRIKNVINYLHENYYLDIGLQSIANLFDIHKVHLARIFKAETGTTLIDYLNTLRIQKAKLLLYISDYKINDIVYIVGYNNPQNFYTLFKKHVDCSPTEYRNHFGRPSHGDD